MMKLILAGLLAFGLLQAPEMEPEIENDPKAKEILDKTSTAFKALNTIKADLDITMNIPEQDPFVQEAVVYIKDQSYRLEMKDEIIICDNKSIWRYLKELNEVQISDYEPADDEITPTNIFNIYENDFYYQYTNLEKVENQSFHVIDLTPMDKTKSFFKVRVWVSSSDSFIHKMKVFDKNGSRYLYELDKLEKNGDYNDSIFQFNKTDYPDVYIEDLRF